jgi:GxxExxY protein
VTENELAKIAISIAFDMHTTLGPGLFESVYETIMQYELENSWCLAVKRQQPIAVLWKNQKQEVGFRADLILENKLIIEIKSIDTIAPVHYKQLLTYLRLTNIKLGLLINFNEELLKTGIKRVVNGL